MGRLCEVACEACGASALRFGEGAGQQNAIYCQHCQTLQSGARVAGQCAQCGGSVTRADGLIHDPSLLQGVACKKCGKNRLRLNFVGSYFVDSDLDSFLNESSSRPGQEKGWMGDPDFRTPWNQG